MTEVQTNTNYTAVQQDEGIERVLGAVSLDADGVIHVQASEPAEAENLERIVREMNRSKVLHAPVPPPPDTPRFAVASRIVSRGEPEFLPLLIEELRKYYSVELRPD